MLNELAKSGSLPVELPQHLVTASRRLLSSLGFDRHTHEERRVLAQHRLDPDSPAVQFHDTLGDRQAQPCAALALADSGIALLELLKYLCLILLPDARPGVGHCRQKRTVGDADPHGDRTLLGEFDGVP